MIRHPGIKPEKKDGEGSKIAMDLDQLKKYVDVQLHDVKAQLHDVKAQLLHLENNFSQQFVDLTAYSQNILCIVNNLDKGLEISGATKASNIGTSQNGNGSKKLEENAASAPSIEEESSEDGTTQTSKQETPKSDELNETKKKMKAPESENRNVQEVEETKVPLKRHSIDRTAAPRKTQPSTVAAQKPVLDDKALKQSARSAVDKYMASKDMKIIKDTLDSDFATEDSLIKFVDLFIDYFMEQPTINQRNQMPPILINILNSETNNLTPQIIAKRFYAFPLRMNIKPGEVIHSLEASKLWDHLAFLIGHMLTSKLFNYDHVWLSCKSILFTQAGERVLYTICMLIHSLKGRLWCYNKWFSSNVHLVDFTAHGLNFVHRNKNLLNYLLSKDGFPDEDVSLINSQILQILWDHPNNALCPVLDWVNMNWGSNPQNPILVRPLLKAVWEVIGAGHEISNSAYSSQYDLSLLKNHVPLLKFFINPSNIWLKDICDTLDENKENYRVLVLDIFSHLLMLNLISRTSLKLFHISNKSGRYSVVNENSYFWNCLMKDYDIKAF